MQVRTVGDKVRLTRDVEESFALSIAEAMALIRNPEFAEALAQARRNARERLAGEIAAHELAVKRLKEQMA